MAGNHDQDTSSSRYGVFAAKIQVPNTPSGLVIRPRLYTQLQPLLQAKVCLVSAPAGFGKTTLISAAIRHFSWNTAWLSLESSDNNPLRFWMNLFQSLRAVHSGFQSPPSNFPYTDFSQHFDRWMGWLLSRLGDTSEDYLVVLDDYHFIENQTIHDGVRCLLNRLPGNIHLVLITRTDPPFPLARKRVNRDLIEVRAGDLRFQSDETLHFLNTVGNLSLSDDDVQLLEQRTEGWAAGLQIAALCLQDVEHGRAVVSRFTGANAYLADYLTEEVLQSLPDEVYSFLLETSLLGDLTADLCDAVTGRTDGRAMLDYLEHANLFLVRLDDYRQWYRYHALFAEFLHQRLKHTGEERAVDLHRRACSWYVQHSLYEAAIIHALAIPDYDYAGDLLVEAAFSMVFRGEIVTLLHCLALLPCEQIQMRPLLELLFAWTRLMTGELCKVEEVLQRLEAWEMMNEDAALLYDFRSQVYSIRSELAHLNGDVTNALTFAQKALEHVSGEHAMICDILTVNLSYVQWSYGDLEGTSQTLGRARSHCSGDSPLLVDILALNSLARLQALRGELYDASASYEEALHLAETKADHRLELVGLIEVGLAELDYQWNRIDQALIHARRGIELGASCLYIKSLLTGYFTVALSQHALHQSQEAAATLKEVEWLIRKAGLTPLLRYLQALRARLSLMDGHLTAAGTWTKKSQLNPAAKPAYWDEYEYLTLTQIRIVQGRASEIIPLLEYLETMAEQEGRVTSLIEILVLLSLAHGSRHEVVTAQRTLDHALALAEPQNYVRVFLDKGPRLADLLQQAPNKTGYVTGLLNAFAEVESHRHSTLVPVHDGNAMHSSTGIEPLSDRELEVLSLVAEGLSNQAIAERLVISVGTVKTHVKNVLHKLQARNRTQAVALARKSHILPSG